MKIAPLLLAITFPLLAVVAQTDKPTVPADAAMFHSEALAFTLFYPKTLVAQKLPTPDEQHELSAKHEPADKPAELRKVDQSTDILLNAISQENPNRPGASTIVHGSLLITRIKLSCMPEQYQQQVDQVLSAGAAAGIANPDLTPIEHPVFYFSGGLKIHFACARGPSGALWVASLAFQSQGSVAIILIRADSLSLLNQILHSSFRIAGGPSNTLFPPDIGAGPPMPIHP